MNSNKNIFTFVCVSVFIIFLSSAYFFRSDSVLAFVTSFVSKPQELMHALSQSVPRYVTIGDHRFLVSIADTEALRVKGLSGRDAFNANEGMLFIFDKADMYSFWMKDMKFTIDIIWIDDAKKIINCEHSVRPQTYPNAFYPQEPARYVLEVSDGVCSAYGFKKGDSVVF